MSQESSDKQAGRPVRASEDWLEDFALHVRNQTLQIVVDTLRTGVEKGIDPEAAASMTALANCFEKAKATPAGEWWANHRESTPRTPSPSPAAGPAEPRNPGVGG